MKLKTLKDLEEEDIGLYPSSINKLKAEAIKWVKHLVLTYNYQSSDRQIFWIMDFFNITEEDLKNE